MTDGRDIERDRERDRETERERERERESENRKKNFLMLFSDPLIHTATFIF